MPSILNPYLRFKDNARQALEFYQGVFGGDLDLSTFGEFGSPDVPEADLIMHGQLTSPRGFTLMASDSSPAMGEPGANGSLSLSGDDAAELRGYWEGLSTDGTVEVPLERQVWGDEYGQCVDAFGVRWMVNIAGDTGSTQS